MKYIVTSIIAALALGLTACKGYHPTQPLHPLLAKIHVIDVEQGNVISEDQLHRIHKGMRRAEVRDILGDPVLAETFNSRQWQYVYTIQKGMHARKQRHVTVNFDHSGLVASVQQTKLKSS